MQVEITVAHKYVSMKIRGSQLKEECPMCMHSLVHAPGECRQPACHVGYLGKLLTLLMSVMKCCYTDAGDRK